MELKVYKEVENKSDFTNFLVKVCSSYHPTGVIKLQNVNGYCVITYSWRVYKGAELTYVGGCDACQVVEDFGIEFPLCISIENGIYVEEAPILYV